MYFAHFRYEEDIDVGVLVGYNGTGRGHLVHSRDHQKVKLQPSPQ